MMGCREGSTFVPSDPTTVRERILTELDASPTQHTRAIAAGVTTEVVQYTAVRCETGENLRFLLDWTSEVNHLTITLYQTGESPDDSSAPTAANCRVPGALAPTPPSFPICPVVVSVTTRDKPKALEQSADRRRFSVVVTNNGPGNETVRWALRGFGRHTRVC